MVHSRKRTSLSTIGIPSGEATPEGGGGAGRGAKEYTHDGFYLVSLPRRDRCQ